MSALADALGLSEERRKALEEDLVEIKVKVPVPIRNRLHALKTLDAVSVSDYVSHVLGVSFGLKEPDDVDLLLVTDAKARLRMAQGKLREGSKALRAKREAERRVRLASKPKKSFAERNREAFARKQAAKRRRFAEVWRCPVCTVFETDWPAAKARHAGACGRKD